jgi:DNA-binding MarR family transcriptional regulator
MAVELLSKENIEKLLSPKQLAVWEYLDTVVEATPGEISKATKVARPTINQAVDKLIRLKKIERIGLGRTTRYKKIITEGEGQATLNGIEKYTYNRA